MLPEGSADRGHSRRGCKMEEKEVACSFLFYFYEGFWFVVPVNGIPTASVTVAVAVCSHLSSALLKRPGSQPHGVSHLSSDTSTSWAVPTLQTWVWSPQICQYSSCQEIGSMSLLSESVILTNIEYGGNHTIWILKLGYKRSCCFHLVLLRCFLCEKASDR